MTYIFVYNADASLFSQVTDFAHKVLSPDTYECNLCKITYGNFAMKTQWKEFVSSFNTPVAFLHKDEFVVQYPNQKDTDFPCMFVEHDGELSLCVSAKEMNSIQTIDELIALVQNVASKKEKQTI